MDEKNTQSRRFPKWQVKTIRPEEIYQTPLEYFDELEVKKYASSSRMKNAQRDIAQRILELLEDSSQTQNAQMLDLGCGVGYTTEFYVERGNPTTGLDINPKMLEYASAKGLKVVLGDIRDIPQLFKPNSFAYVVSASALQWITTLEDFKKIANGINYVLESKGRGVIQFYPKSEEILENFNRIFSKNGFLTETIVDSPNNPKKRMCYLILTKIQ